MKRTLTVSDVIEAIVGEGTLTGRTWTAKHMDVFIYLGDANEATTGECRLAIAYAIAESDIEVNSDGPPEEWTITANDWDAQVRAPIMHKVRLRELAHGAGQKSQAPIYSSQP